MGEDTFNRAKLLNIGYMEAQKDGEYDCFIFSDVDLIPMDDRNLYHCYDQPRHFAIAMDKFGFRLPYAGYFGGVSGLSKKQFLKINGFPNEYWGWGGEDDDIYNRITLNGMKVSRPDVRIGRYRMIKHERDKHNEPNPQRFNKIQNTKHTMKKDGISSLTYKLLQIKRYPLYTNISVEIGKPPPRPIKAYTGVSVHLCSFPPSPSCIDYRPTDLHHRFTGGFTTGLDEPYHLRLFQYEHLSPTQRLTHCRRLPDSMTDPSSYQTKNLIQHLDKSQKDEKSKTIDMLFEEMRQMKDIDEQTLTGPSSIVTHVTNLIQSGEIKKYKDVERAKTLSQSRDKENLEEILAVLCSAVHQHMAEGKWWPRATQMISWCLLALSDTEKLLEMGTREGKSWVIAMFAVLRVSHQ
ncbi:Beta-1,4-galactosyltransferase 2 [Oryzias melastigma]|uniref:Beta-1,4-galactosyltransferase n=1 Tax=Oryzias melastigma TaxID=30732 RepID=A0A834FE16_ORYME|nr:Beta-1,4-galactosyltransferase 2 [Oryzias melastigma]